MKKVALIVAGLFAALIVIVGIFGDSEATNSDAASTTLKGEGTSSVTTEKNKESQTSSSSTDKAPTESNTTLKQVSSNKVSVGGYSGDPYVICNNNVPAFKATELTSVAFESYSSLDSLGRVGVAFACLGEETMPKAGEERGSISAIKPTGWVQNKYDCVQGGWLYNRCHLIGWQLSAENANKRNLMTGTRDFNIYGMLVWEDIVAEYIHQTGNHVMYRVTPKFEGNNLLASGVTIEAYSVEDKGEGIKFNVYCYNVQPGVTIDYSTGRNSAAGAATTKATTKTYVTTTKPTQVAVAPNSEVRYIMNADSKKIHYPSCGSVKRMNEENKVYWYGSYADLVAKYPSATSCGNCHAK